VAEGRAGRRRSEPRTTRSIHEVVFERRPAAGTRSRSRPAPRGRRIEGPAVIEAVRHDDPLVPPGLVRGSTGWEIVSDCTRVQ